MTQSPGESWASIAVLVQDLAALPLAAFEDPNVAEELAAASWALRRVAGLLGVYADVEEEPAPRLVPLVTRSSWDPGPQPPRYGDERTEP